MSKPDGGPAFPCSPTQVLGTDYAPGMTLRDYFAAAALNALIIGHINQGIIATGEQSSQLAYEYADAMLLERSKGSKP